MPDGMNVDRDEHGWLYYEYSVGADDAPINKNSTFRLTSFNVPHIPGLGFDGLVDYSLIAMAKNAIGMAIAGVRRSTERSFGAPRHYKRSAACA